MEDDSILQMQILTRQINVKHPPGTWDQTYIGWHHCSCGRTRFGPALMRSGPFWMEFGIHELVSLYESRLFSVHYASLCGLHHSFITLSEYM